MAHEVEQMFYAGEVPWHGLGKSVEGALTSAEAIVDSGLDWEVGLHPMRVEIPFDDGQMGMSEFESMRVIYRKSDRRPLGVSGPGYRPIQNREAFDFMDGLVATGDVRYETAGSLRQGERIFMLARLPREIKIGAGDIVYPYMLLTTAHDGKAACRVLPTTVRVVCMNTLNVAIAHTFGPTAAVGDGIDAPEVGEGKKRVSKELWVKIHHKGNIASKLQKAQQVLEIVNTTFDNFAETANALNGVSGDDMLEPLFEMLGFTDSKNSGLLLPEPTGPVLLPEVTDSRRKANNMEFIRLMYKAEPQTAWGALNAFTGFYDHGHKARSVRGRDEKDARMDTLMLGYKAAAKQRAYTAVLQLAGVKA